MPGIPRLENADGYLPNDADRAQKWQTQRRPPRSTWRIVAWDWIGKPRGSWRFFGRNRIKGKPSVLRKSPENVQNIPEIRSWFVDLLA
jgi:hypothetical protein